MIIDCHGHYTTGPEELGEYREQQKRELAQDPQFTHKKGQLNITDDQLRESLENNQLRLQRERGTDMTIFSPRASWMGHHIGNELTSKYWSEHCNELIARITELYPENFIGGCQLPQTEGAPLDNAVAELRRCVSEFNFVGCNLNLDPSGGHWKSPPLGDRYWYPIYEAMCDLDVPAMIHVSGCCNPAFHATGSYYLSADTVAFMQLMTSDVCKDFPDIKFIIPHGGGAVPYHWGRFRGLADMMKLPPLDELVMNNVYFDTCVYHQPGIDLLLDVIPNKNILFASEMVGAVRGIDPQTGQYFDDTKRYIDNANISQAEKDAIFDGNIRKVFSRIKD
ncbi:amidohydrolase family protein [Paraglaciecola polaris]|uniref:Aminocarboxymuconate-semialdehyde decarboxylase n=1 Tax=Paraglaciecola polaris LMG 21857 TaxID=1129793 RepID=K6ZVB0_9ALTE|nr:amidohydrolase family protein [Paraglaciecola polaris]GAC34227.1 aminocarboxymuconate-semialdehyde decarboxylase [Paraglaciecola polaris LMG 21857]|tara:strand:+ start:1058 stop:2065 length:1008 start_codon:yes stop_codon:yes gene_type:complete